MTGSLDAFDDRAKLGRFHSLLFGIDRALANVDHETALGLAVRLLGFLSSESNTPEDEMFSRKFLSQVQSDIVSIRRATQTDREALAQAGCAKDFRFPKTNPVHLERMKRSKYLAKVFPTASPVEESKRYPVAEPKLESKSSTSVHIEEEEEEGEAGAEDEDQAQEEEEVEEDVEVDEEVDEEEEEEEADEEAEEDSDILEDGAPSNRGQTKHGSTQKLDSQVERGPSSTSWAWKRPDSNSESPAERGPYSTGRSWNQSKLTHLYGGPYNPASPFKPPQIPPTSLEQSNQASSSYCPPRPANEVTDNNKEDESRKRAHSPPKLSWQMKRPHRVGLSHPPPPPPPVEDSDDETKEIRPCSFITGNQKLQMDEAKKNAGKSNSTGSGHQGYHPFGGKNLGMTRRGPGGPFIPHFAPRPPLPSDATSNGPAPEPAKVPVKAPAPTKPAPKDSSDDDGEEDATQKCLDLLTGPDGELPIRIRSIDPKLLVQISNEIMDQDVKVQWDDIAGLDHAKKCVTEMVIWPLLRPDIFKGCRAPGKGLLLFGPPGTGKTMIGKAIAGEAKATFFSISASSLTSKWLGEGEKLVRALFGVASCRQPAVIFIDEIDSLLSQRKSDGEPESSRRLKTQFLIEMEGCGTEVEQVLLIGATNRPQELDEAARRRLSKRLYIPLPCAAARAWIIRSVLDKDGLFSLSDDEIDKICECTDGYSGSDMKNLVKEASMGPLREALISVTDISQISNESMRPINLQDFMSAIQQVRASVSQDELGMYEDWNSQFGSLAI